MTTECIDIMHTQIWQYHLTSCRVRVMYFLPEEEGRTRTLRSRRTRYMAPDVSGAHHSTRKKLRNYVLNVFLAIRKTALKVKNAVLSQRCLIPAFELNDTALMRSLPPDCESVRKVTEALYLDKKWNSGSI